MAIPTIATAGLTDSLLLITDHEGVTHRIPKNSVCDMVNSSTDTHNRLEICHARGSVVLIFDTDEQVVGVLGQIDALY